MICYMNVETNDVSRFLGYPPRGKVIDRLLYRTRHQGKDCPRAGYPILQISAEDCLRQQRSDDPGRIDDYIAVGGYQGLEKVLFGMKPEEVVETIKKSGLRGRGGGGFSTEQNGSLAKGKRKGKVCHL